MQKTFVVSEKLQKTASSHFKRYSEHDFRTNQIDKLLITQTSLHPQSKIRSIKTKLPSISTFAPSAFNSQNNKINKVANVIDEMKRSIRESAEDLQTIKLNFQEQRRSSEERLQKTSISLSSKIDRLSEMVEYRAKEDLQRSQLIKTECYILEENTKFIKGQISKVSLKMKDIENMMGVYTGQDKYLI